MWSAHMRHHATQTVLLPYGGISVCRVLHVPTSISFLLVSMLCSRYLHCFAWFSFPMCLCGWTFKVVNSDSAGYTNISYGYPMQLNAKYSLWSEAWSSLLYWIFSISTVDPDAYPANCRRYMNTHTAISNVGSNHRTFWLKSCLWCLWAVDSRHQTAAFINSTSSRSNVSIVVVSIHFANH